jgi:hypothetical protein
MIKESTIETKTCDYAKSLDWVPFKFTSPGNKAVPDRLFLRASKIFFIEFKALGKKPTKLQAHCHRMLRGEGFNVYVVDNVEYGKEVIDNES